MVEVAIPKNLQHIWIGPNPAPVGWMETWPAAHPSWDYTVFDNQALATRRFRTQHLIDRYMALGLYAGAADLIRYELLYERGGYQAGADSICLRAVDPLLTKVKAYAVYENERMRGALVAPVVACEPKNTFVGKLVRDLARLTADDLGAPWITTGNLFVTNMIAQHEPDIVIWPSHTLIPVHYTGDVYEGDGQVYAVQMFGSTRSAYAGKNTLALRNWYERIRQRKAKRKLRAADRKRTSDRFHEATQHILDGHGFALPSQYKE